MAPALPSCAQASSSMPERKTKQLSINHSPATPAICSRLVLSRTGEQRLLASLLTLFVVPFHFSGDTALLALHATVRNSATMVNCLTPCVVSLSSLVRAWIARRLVLSLQCSGHQYVFTAQLSVIAASVWGPWGS
jgi:hypothetical protein